MSIWRPCTFCGQPLAATDHDHGCPHVRLVHLQPDGVYINGKKVSHDIMSDTDRHIVQQFATRPEIVEAVQWHGPEDLPLLQIWLAPISPLYRPPTGSYNDEQPTITVPCYDAERTQQYPTLGKQYTDTKVVPGSWVIRLASGELIVRMDTEMQATYQRVPVPVPAAMPEQAVPGDDVDPTGVVPGVPVVADGPITDEVLAELHAAQATRGDDPARVSEATAPGDEIKF